MPMATSLRELQEQIRERYDSLSKRLQQVAHYVLDNTNSIAFDTVATIAERADVPPSTLIRFANAFDFSGFNEMKQLFRMNLVEETASYTDRARLFRAMEADAVPETPLDILHEFARSNAQAMQQLAARTPQEDLQKPLICWRRQARSISWDYGARSALPLTSPMRSAIWKAVRFW